MEVAVAGGHNILMIGPPGSGKSMIAKRIPSIMPEPTLNEYLEIINIHSAAGKTIHGDMDSKQRFFRTPHHTISDAGLLGGGTIPGPGDSTLLPGRIAGPGLPVSRRQKALAQREIGPDPGADRQFSGI